MNRVLQSVAACAIVAGVAVPADDLMQALRGEGALAPTLVAGGQLIRLALVLTGVLLLVGAYQRWWVDDPPQRPRPRVSGMEVVLLGSLILAATALRLIGLDAGLWVDEISTLVDYVRPSLGQILTTYEGQNQHFLFSVLAHASVAAFGESHWSLRLPSAVFGIATVWAVWSLGRQVASRREALLAAAVLTFSYQHIWFSQNARGYAGLLFWSVISTTLLVRGLEAGARRVWAAYGLTVALGLYTHMTMIFVVGGQGLAFLLEMMRRRRTGLAVSWLPLITGFGLGAVLTFALYAPTLPQIPEAAAADLSDVAEWRSVGWWLRETVQGLAAGPLASMVVIAGALVVGIGTRSYWRETLVLPVVFLAPIAAGATAMIALGHHLWPRFFFFAAAFAVLIAVRGVFEVADAIGRTLRWSEPFRSAAPVVSVVAAIAVLGHSLPYVYRPKQDFLGARAFVDSSRDPADAVVVVGAAKYAYRLYAPTWRVVETADALDAVRRASPGTWVVYTLPVEMEENYSDVLDRLHQDFGLVREFDGSLNGGTVYVWSTKRPFPEVP